MPKKDECDICFAWKNMPDDLKTEERTKEFNAHWDEKERSYKFKGNLKELAASDPTMHCAAFDFKKTLLCLAAGSSSDFCYCMRLRNYNLQ